MIIWTSLQVLFLNGGVNVPDEIQKIIPILERLTPRQLEMINELAVELAELNEKDSSEKQNLMEI